MSQFETNELAARPEALHADASHALLADSFSNPFQVAAKADVKPVLVASNEPGCQYSQPVEPHTPAVEPHPNPNPQPGDQTSYNTNNLHQDQVNQQYLDSHNTNVNQVDGRVSGNNTSNIGIHNDVRTGDANVNSSSNSRVGDVSSQSHVGDVGASANNSGGNSNNVYRSTNTNYTNMRAESLPGNQCTTLAVRADGYFMGTGGGIGVSNSSNKCIEAIAEKVTCEAPAALAAANERNSAAAQSWLAYANDSQRAQIIQHGVNNMQRISDNATAKSAACLGEKAEVAAPPPQTIVERQVVVPPPNMATQQDLRELEQRQNQKLDRAWEHGLRK